MATLPTGIFSLDYTNTVWQLLVPPDKRRPKWLAWGGTLMAGKQWKNDAFFGSYMLGSTDAAYNASSGGYTVGQRVIYYINGGGNYYGDNAVYEALTTVPTNTPPTGTNIVPSVMPSWVINSTTALQWLATGNGGNPFYWVQVQPNFIGLLERANWSCQQLTMEVALNKWFNVSAYANYQWDHTGSPPFTQIYIETNNLDTGEEYWPPYVSTSPGGYYWSALTKVTDQQSFWPPIPESIFKYDFTIYVPVAVFNNLVSGSAFSSGHTEDISTVTRNGSIIRNLVDRMNAVGMIYSITIY